ncbi:MAG: efflux RND transporter periplasmic adaptor subunit [Bryobacteraceae bacterium]
MKTLILVFFVLALAGCGRKTEPGIQESSMKKDDEAHPDKYIEVADVVELSMDAQRRAGIEVGPVHLANVQTQIRMTGTVEPVDSRLAQVRPLARGRVVQVLVKVGDRVIADQTLVRFDNIEASELLSQLDTARAELQRLRIQQANAQKQAERSRSLVNIGAVPAKDAESAEAEARGMEESVRAQQSVISGIETRTKRFGVSSTDEAGAASIRAPFAGVVTQIDVAPGAVVDSSSTLLSLADLTRVYVEGQVYERDLGKVRLGQPARISLEAYPGQYFQGRVASIRDVLDPTTRTAGVRCEVDNSSGRLKLEMFATLSIPTSESHSALSVPADAVQTINRRQVVFVREGELHFEAREVQVSGDGPDVEILAGLKDGEPVVTKGAFQLKSAFLARQLQSEHEHDR